MRSYICYMYDCCLSWVQMIDVMVTKLLFVVMLTLGVNSEWRDLTCFVFNYSVRVLLGIQICTGLSTLTCAQAATLLSCCGSQACGVHTDRVATTAGCQPLCFNTEFSSCKSHNKSLALNVHRTLEAFSFETETLSVEL